MLLTNVTYPSKYNLQERLDRFDPKLHGGEFPDEFSKYLANKLAIDAKLRLFQQLHQDTETDFYRASGACLCEFCGLEYRKHPYDEELAVNRLCNGELVHL